MTPARPACRRCACVTATAFVLAAGFARVAAAGPADSDWALRLDLDSVHATTPVSTWLDGGVGRLRYGDGSPSVTIARAAFAFDGHQGHPWTAHVVGDYADRDGVGLTEAYAEWRPVPKSPLRQQLRIGAFFPPLSLENVNPGWSSPYSPTPSAINTWFGEEIRAVGVEWSADRPLGREGRRVRLSAAVFGGNDPAGALIAWKGWGLHDRQTRLAETRPLPAVPQTAPGMMFSSQAPEARPFLETDDRPGYYVATEWQLARRARLAFAQYDNHADPVSLREGQYGWRTRFDHAGLALELPARLGLVAQWIRGTTQMGPAFGGIHVVDARYDARFVLLTRRFGPNRLSVRRESFGVDDRDATPLDANGETGKAWTLAYAHELSPKLTLDAEWLRVDSSRDAWVYFGTPTSVVESVARVRVSYTLGRRDRQLAER